MTREFHPSRGMKTCRVARWALVAALAVLGPWSASARAADATFTLDFGNAYIWRGIVLNDDGVMQFSLDAQPLDAWGIPIGFNVWGNYDIGDYDGQVSGSEISELDLVVYASLPAGFEVGYIEYQFPQTEFGDTREFYVTWSKDMIITPTISFYYDFGEINAAYSSLDLTYSLPLEGKFSWSVSGLVGLAGKGFAEVVGGTKGGFYNYNLYTSLGYQISEPVGLQATGGYSGSLDTAVLPEQPLGGYILAGISFAF